jgi:hypothetical protein
MAHRIYLIPFETDADTIRASGMTALPKHLNLLGTAVANAPRITGRDEFKQAHFIIKVIETPGSGDRIAELEKQADVIRLDGTRITDTQTKSRLTSVGVDLAGLSPVASETDLQTEVMKWMTDEDIDFTKLNTIGGE